MLVQKVRQSERFALFAVRAALLALSCGFCMPAFAESQYYVRSLAGSPNPSIDGIGTAARFGDPYGLVVDASGNVFVTDSENSTIRRIAPDGSVTTLAGVSGENRYVDGPGGYARFSHIGGIAIDAAGNLFVADIENALIRKVTPAGLVSTVAGKYSESKYIDGDAGIARLHDPVAIAVDAAGAIYFTEFADHTVRKISPAGTISTLAGMPGQSGSADGNGSAARFANPNGLALDSSGNIFVADSGNSTIRKLAPDGTVTTYAGTAGSGGGKDGTLATATFDTPAGLGFDGSGNLIVTDFDSTIRKISPSGNVTTLAGTVGVVGSADGTGPAAQFLSPGAVATDSNGTLYIADRGNNLIRVVTPGGVVTSLAGGVLGPRNGDGTGSGAMFKRMAGVAVDSAGNVFVPDSENYTIRKITPVGVVTTLAGKAGTPGFADGQGSAAHFALPFGITLDAGGNLFVADSALATIRKITPDGTVTTFAGSINPFQLPDVDGNGPNARFINPYGICIDPSGNFYVTETVAHVIRKITPAGDVTTFAGTFGKPGTSDGTGSQAQFNAPRSIVSDNTGTLYVADYGNHAIRKITPAGVVSTFSGTPGVSGSTDNPPKFNFPAGLALDGAGNLFVSDAGNNTLRMIAPGGAVSTLAGLALSSGINDGLGSAARFDNPLGLAIDKKGTLYIADTMNNSIRIASQQSDSVTGVAVIDSIVGPLGQARSLNVQPQTASAYKWRIVRRPPNSTANLSSTSIVNPTFIPDAHDTYVFQVEATETVGYSISNVSLTALDAAVTDPTSVNSGISISRNPVRTNTDVMFMTSTPVPPDGKPFTYEWYFLYEGKLLDGTLTGNPVTHPFSQEGTYSVIVVLSDDVFKLAEIKTFSVTLDPNKGASGVSVVTADKIPNNPDNGLGLSVTGSKGGVVDLDIVPSGTGAGTVAAARAGPESFDVVLQKGTYHSAKLADKYTAPGIYKVAVTGTVPGTGTAGPISRLARLMLPVGSNETSGTPGFVDQRTNTGATATRITGKFSFSLARTETFALDAAITLPAGLQLSQSMPISVGISNVTDAGVVDKRGNVTGLSSNIFKKVQVHFPRVDKNTGKTVGGETAKISATMTATGLSRAGFDTDGISGAGARGVIQNRKLQFAVVLGGVPYYDLMPVLFQITTDRSGNVFGSIRARN